MFIWKLSKNFMTPLMRVKAPRLFMVEILKLLLLNRKLRSLMISSSHSGLSLIFKLIILVRLKLIDG